MDKTAGPPDANAPLAALLVRAARANLDYDPRQVAMIDSVLCERLDLAPAQSRALRQAGERLESATGDTVHLTRAVKALVALDDRAGLLQDMWRVILADHARHDEEDGLMRLVSNLLGLADRDSAFARQRAQAQQAERAAHG
ncbi:MAG: TerB family tellurite resistance protein [Rhodobacteraceae bacterium]|nr:TerB family tellurite resistance protein [Paracoccaceae bacterium]